MLIWGRYASTKRLRNAVSLDPKSVLLASPTVYVKKTFANT